MKSVSPSLWRARLTHRLALCLSLLLLSSSLPFVTHGQLQTDAETAREAAVKQASAGRKRVEFVPGRVLVRFRTDTAAKAAETRVASVKLADGAEAATEVERFEGSD